MAVAFTEATSHVLVAFPDPLRTTFGRGQASDLGREHCAVAAVGTTET